MAIPAGEVEALDGRRFVNDDAQAIVDAFTKQGLDLPVDFEHASEVTRGSGTKYRVAGYIKELQVRDGALYARIEWSEIGRTSIESGEYKVCLTGIPAYQNLAEGSHTHVDRPDGDPGHFHPACPGLQSAGNHPSIREGARHGPQGPLCKAGA